jgi:hypothetical protein
LTYPVPSRAAGGWRCGVWGLGPGAQWRRKRRKPRFTARHPLRVSPSRPCLGLIRSFCPKTRPGAPSRERKSSLLKNFVEF